MPRLFAAAAVALCAGLMACHHHMSASGTVDSGPSGVDPQFPVSSGSPGVPLLPTLSNTQAVADDDRVSVTFDPIADAGDYRIYPLPTADQVTVASDGSVVVKNAVYRCAGDRDAWAVSTDVATSGSWFITRVATPVEGYTRAADANILGYAFSTPAADRVAVYALGDPQERGDNECDIAGGDIFNASRVKTYALQAGHDTLVSQGWRDDGVAFYAPISGTVQVDTAVLSDASVLYFSDPAEIAARGTGTAAPFTLLASAATGSEPVMRVYYDGGCSHSHDELVLGLARYQRILTQGPQPIFEASWSGNTALTTYVVEALDNGCPFPGQLSFGASAAAGNAQAFITLANAQAQSATGEVYLNGQHDPANKPRAIARSYVKVAPAPRAASDFFDGFATDPGFTLASSDNHGFEDAYLTSAKYDAQFYSVEPGKFSLGAVGGELWATYADWESDTPGKFRLTPKQQTTLSASTFLHVTAMADLASTNRRYPQILISDQVSPVQDNLAQGTTLIMQVFYGWPSLLQLQICDHRTWDVNNQCPSYHLMRTPFSAEPWAPIPNVGELSAPALLKRLDFYVSTQRAYLLLDGKPYGCANLAVAPPAGPVSVTLGDTLYHSGVDEVITSQWTGYVFQKTYQLTETQRRFDSLSFTAGVAAPDWNETVLPCTSVIDGQ